MLDINDELLHAAAIAKIKGCGPLIAIQLRRAAKSWSSIFTQEKKWFKRQGNLSNQVISSIIERSSFPQAVNVLAEASRSSYYLTAYGLPSYPYRLALLPNPPILLFSSSPLHNLAHTRAISIVGTRQITPYGRMAVKKIIEELMPYNPIIISGLAYGIDILAHQTALKNDLPTWAVLAGGLDKFYPSVHQSVIKEMQGKRGGLLTEHFIATSPIPAFFPIRNRIIAGLSDATIVIEAAVKSGALITATWANSYHREVFALPGALNSSKSMGCNQLIRQHKAHLLTSGSELAQMLGWKPMNLKSIQIWEQLSSVEKALLRKIQQAGGSMESNQLAKLSGLPSISWRHHMLQLMYKEAVSHGPGPYYHALIAAPPS